MRKIIDRILQHITSKYGRRKGFRFSHRGVDLRSWTDDFKKKLQVVLPENCVFSRTVFQKKWGYTHVFQGLESGYILKFTHVDNPSFKFNVEYPEGQFVGFTRLTDYMKKKGYGDHLHLEVWQGKKTIDPEIYFKEMGIHYE